MPPVAPAIAAAVATAVGSFSLSGFLLSTAASLALSAVSRALAPKPKGPAFSSLPSGITQSVREAIASRKIVYGQTRVSGPMVFIGGTQSNKYLHFVIPLAAHEIESIDEIWINDYAIPNDAINGSGVVTSGRYANYIRIKKKLGTDGQTADSDLVAEISEWTTDHRLRGVAYIYLRLQYSQDIFPSGIPNISAFVKGKKIFDSRIGMSKFTTNAALMQYDYLANSTYGLGAENDINDSVLQASANISDEIVDVENKNYVVSSVMPGTDIITINGEILELVIGDRVEISSSGSIPGGLSASTGYYVIPYQFKTTCRIKLAASLSDAMAGTAIDLSSAGSGIITITKTGEPRYHGGGVIDTEQTLESNIKNLLSATAGKAIYVGGKWLIKAATYSAPSVTLFEDDIIRPVSIQTRVSRQERFNLIKGVYRSPLNYDTTTDWPAVVSDAFATADGESIPREYDTPFTQRPQTSRRVGKIELLRSRQEIVVKAIFNLRALQVQCGDNVMLSIARYGFENKIFEVTNFTFVTLTDKGPPSYGIELILRENDSSVYDWNTSEEQEVDPAPNTTLPNPFDVDAVNGLTFDSTAIETSPGETAYIMSATWNAHSDTFVLEGGSFELQYKQSTESEWRPSFFVSGNLTFSDLFTALIGVSYDIRIRAINNLGAKSGWVTLMNLSPGSGGGVIATDDWGTFSVAHSSSEDWGDYTTSPSLTEDWGTYV